MYLFRIENSECCQNDLVKIFVCFRLTVKMASVKTSVLLEYLQCTLCMEDMKRSCILQCHHSFCIDCLEKYSTSQATADHRKITCPICRTDSNVPNGDLNKLPNNFFMDDLKDLIIQEAEVEVDSTYVVSSSAVDGNNLLCSQENCEGKPVKYCTNDQEYLCQVCAEEHAAHRFTKKHQTITAEEAFVKMSAAAKSYHPCSLHPKQTLDMYCKICEKIICKGCLSADHREHHFTTLDPFIKPCQMRLHSLLERVDKLLKCVEIAMKNAKQEVIKAQHHIVKLKAEVSSTFAEIRQKLAKQEKILLSDLDTAANKVHGVASSTHEKQKLVDENLESLRLQGYNLLTEGDVFDQVSSLPNLEEAVDKLTHIPGVVWLHENKTINPSEVDHFTLMEYHSRNTQQYQQNDTTGATGASKVEYHQQIPESKENGELVTFNVGDKGTGICSYNNIIFLVRLEHPFLYMYGSTGELIKKHPIQGIHGPRDLILTEGNDGAILVIISDTPCLHFISVRRVNDTCVLGPTTIQPIAKSAWGICVNDVNNLVIANRNKKTIHGYSNSFENLFIIKLPFDMTPAYMTMNPSGGYILTDSVYNQIIWIDGKGRSQKCYRDKAHGTQFTDLRGLAMDKENRCIVADRSSNQLLLFSEDGVQSLARDTLVKPYNMYYDHETDKLYVITFCGKVIVYDYYKLLGEKRDEQCATINLYIQPIASKA